MARFIKFIDSEEAEYLLENHPNALLLLLLIAKRARRVSGSPDGLEIGEAHIGDYKKCGLKSRGQYRHALKVLEGRATIKILETCRNRKKATTGATTEGTKVRLLRSDVCDINLETNNHQSNHLTTTEQPPNNHEEECKEDKKDKKIPKENDPLATPLLTEFFASLLQFIPNFNSDKTKHTPPQLAAMTRLLKVHGEIKIRQVFAYAHTNDFWRAHVHTAIYLEKKFETLHEQMLNPPQKNGFRNKSERDYARNLKDKNGNPIKSYAEEKGLF